jgi:uncharacterized membrane protein YfcA
METGGLHDLLIILCGSLVGFSLGLLGGGGSILAVPLMTYVVGVPSVHVAIGTSALAVALNAVANLMIHARAGNVRWGPVAIFSATGVVGSAFGSSLSKTVEGPRLLAFFGLLMFLVAALMLARRSAGSDTAVRPAQRDLPQLLLFGFGAGVLSGFFGIGGGFMIVPGLILATGMPIVNAVGSSLFAVTAFGATAAVSYALSGFVDWGLAAWFIVGGIAGGALGVASAKFLGVRRGALNVVFAAVICIVGAYIEWQSLGALMRR